MQGLTLPVLVRKLGLANAPGQNVEEETARKVVLQSALDFLHSQKRQEAEFDAMYDDLIEHYEHRLKILDGTDSHPGTATADHHKEISRIFRELSRVERATAIRLRDTGQINDEVLRQIEHELDLRDTGNMETL